MLSANSHVLAKTSVAKMTSNILFNPLPDDKILESSKLKELADHNFKFDENGRQLSKQVENTGKRRNCSLRAISPFPQCFQKARFPGASKGVLVWEWVKLIC